MIKIKNFKNFIKMSSESQSQEEYHSEEDFQA
jgi:hypothetical protein